MGRMATAPTKLPRVDVVIPCYNEVSVLRASVEKTLALFAANAQYDWQIVIADNGSNDGERNLTETRRLYYKTFFAPENTEEHRRILRGEWKAWQLYRINEKRGLAKSSFREGKMFNAAKMLAHILVHRYRYLRGYPTERGI